MKITFKGVFTIEEHLLILSELKHKQGGSWEVTKHPNGIAQIKRGNN